jgi:hypothetical protein
VLNIKKRKVGQETPKIVKIVGLIPFGPEIKLKFIIKLFLPSQERKL